MNTLGVWASILFWGAAQLTSGGSITGTIRLSGGGPATGVRVVAMAVPNPARGADAATVFESITETDGSGRYRLDNISPGRYFVAAGPVAYPTFHPGTLTQSAASIVTVTKNSPLLSAVDFTLSAAPSAGQGALPPALQGVMICCRLQARTLMEDRSPVPDFPISMKVVDRRGGYSVNMDGSLWRLDRSFPLSIPINATAEIGIDGLPPGYVLKSVAYGGKDFGLNPFLVDGKSLATLDLTLAYDLASTLRKVTARGKVVNPAPELKVTSIRFASTLPNGPAPVAHLQPDGSFEFADIPVGVYRAGVVDARGGANTSPTIFVIREAVSGLTIDLHNNPFPEFDGVRPERTTFTDGKSTEITGVITQRNTRIRESDAVFFRMNIKDPSTGLMTPWAVFAEHDWQTPRIVVGETLTVPGVPSTDGTNRLYAYPF